jgi:DNA polymerase-3 subunit delta
MRVTLPRPGTQARLDIPRRETKSRRPVPPSRPFILVCGQDDFLVGRKGKERFDVLAAEVADELSRETISGFAANVDEVEKAVNRFRDVVQTVSMFGGRRAVWLKDVNFLADTPTGRADGTLRLVEDLQQILASIDPADNAVLITAAPVDRRRAFLKWCEKHADFTLVGDGEGGEAFAGLVLAEAKALGASLAPGALELLLAKVGANTRLLMEEVRKLASYASQSAATPPGGAPEERCVIEEAHVAELTPNTAEGDFFEAAEAFCSGDLRWTLAALQRHFFTGGDSRPVIAALQNRNRLLIQLRALLDAGEIRLGPRGVDGLAQAAARHGARFAEAAGEKSSFNVFAQNAWYLGKIAGSGRLPSLRRLIDNQQDLIVAFEEIIRRPQEQEEVMRELAVRCLSTG